MNRIGWCDETWNPMTGCTPVSEACEHCYAEAIARRFNSNPYAPEMHFEPMFYPDRLDIPLHWRKPRRIFVCSMSDLFHEAFTDGQIANVLDTIWRCHEAQSGHTFVVLTKRPERMRRLLTVTPTSLHLGVTVEVHGVLWRMWELKKTPAAVRFLCFEPLLTPMPQLNLDGIDWVIVGGETGPGARPMQPEWALDIYQQCKAAGVPFWWKGWGSAFRHPITAATIDPACVQMEVTHELPVTP